MFEFVLEKSTFDLINWSSDVRVSLIQLSVDFGVSFAANYFNIKNSHWEPFVERWNFSITVTSI